MKSMINLIPNTPRSCIEAMATTANNRKLWEKKWTKFYNIYFDFVKLCVINRFKKYRWNVSSDLINDTIALVFINTVKAVKTYNMERSPFHIYLFAVIRFSVLQAIKIRKNDAKAVLLDECKNEIKYFLKNCDENSETAFEKLNEQTEILDELIDKKNFVEELCQEERLSARKALYAELIEETKSRVSPRMSTIFEMRIIEGLSAKDCAQKLNIDPRIVDNDKSRFIKKLNEIAQEEPFASEIAKLRD